MPWATLQAGDRVYIHWRSAPYKEKWVINRQGTANARIEIIGVSGPNGEQPIIDGNGAVTPLGLDYWNEDRGVIKIGGSSIPADGLPSYITIENLEVRSAHPSYQFTTDNGSVDTYVDNAASIYVEKCANLIIRNCTLHDSGNGLFIGAFNGQTENVLLEKNHIYGNGIVGSSFQHNSYTSALGIIYQYNRFGALRNGADGNNLKDRSAGLVVRYNWIEDGNRQLDLVNAYDVAELLSETSYDSTFVYGNVLIESDGEGNSQIMHYGGDTGPVSTYRKGDLYFYNNTVVSTRTGTTTLVRLSSNDETAHIFNNVFYPTASGSNFAITDGSGTANLNHNWLKTNWVDCHCAPSGTINDLGNNLNGNDPLFQNFSSQEFKPQTGSPLINQGSALPSTLLPDNDLILEYVKHLDFVARPTNSDIGAFRYNLPTNIASLENNGLLLYPNPSTDFLHLESKNALDKQTEVTVLNIHGQELQLECTVDATRVTLDCNTLPNGVYFLKVINTNQENRIRFLKQ